MRAPGLGGRGGFTTRKTWKRWNHREKSHPPHPQHNRHSGKQDEDGARPSAPHQHPLEHQLTRQPHFKPHAHRDQDVGTQGQTSPDVDKSATPHARPPQPKAKYSLWFGSQPSAHTPAHGTTTSLLHQVTKRMHTAQSWLHNCGARIRHPHTPGGRGPQRKPQPCTEGTGPSTSSWRGEPGEQWGGRLARSQDSAGSTTSSL